MILSEHRSPTFPDHAPGRRSMNSRSAERQHQFAMLVGAGIVHDHHTPLGPLCNSASRSPRSRTRGVADIDRLQPFDIAECRATDRSGRPGSAARAPLFGRLRDGGDRPCSRIHCDRGVPARRAQRRPKWRLRSAASSRHVEAAADRTVARRFDGVGRERCGCRAPSVSPTLNVLENISWCRPHYSGGAFPGRRRSVISAVFMVITTASGRPVDELESEVSRTQVRPRLARHPAFEHGGPHS